MICVSIFAKLTFSLCARALEAENANLKEEYNNLKTVGQIPPLQV